MRIYVGIDVSKDKFDVAIPNHLDPDQYLSYTFTNDENGINEFLKLANPKWHVVLEATGVYSLLISHELELNNIRLSVINPLKSKHFGKALNQSAKTDKQDARRLSLYGKCMSPKVTLMPERTHYEFKQKRLYIKQLKKRKQASFNILHSLMNHPFPDQETVENFEKDLAELNKKIKDAEKKIVSFTTKIYHKQYKLLTSIVGIGPKTAVTLIYSTNAFQSFDSPKQFSRFVGISPTVYESGSSVKHKGRMNRSGDPDVRKLLYIATWSAIRYNNECKKKYEELLARGKPSMVALVAIMNKLIRQAFGVIRNDKMFDNNYQHIFNPKNTL